VHPYAWALARRTSLAASAATVIAAAIVALTDEATSTVGMRLARLAALGPLVGGLSALAVCAHARARGEIVTLGALGEKPWEAAMGAAVAAWAFGVVSTMVLASPWSDAESLFPRLVPAIDWIMDPSGSLAQGGGAVVFADGKFEHTEASIRQVVSGPSRWTAVACSAPLALATPAWAVVPMSAVTRVTSLLVAAAMLIVALHLIAAERVHALFGMTASLPLLASLNLARRQRP
jgi:hypothetical protein